MLGSILCLMIGSILFLTNIRSTGNDDDEVVIVETKSKKKKEGTHIKQFLHVVDY